MREELGVTTELAWLYQFQYSASFGDKGSENELCAVLIGDIDESGSVVKPNRQEVLDWGWYDSATVDLWVRQEPEQFTPWFLLEWARLRGEHYGGIREFCARRRQPPAHLSIQ